MASLVLLGVVPILAVLFLLLVSVRVARTPGAPTIPYHPSWPRRLIGFGFVLAASVYLSGVAADLRALDDPGSYVAPLAVLSLRQAARALMADPWTLHSTMLVNALVASAACAMGFVKLLEGPNRRSWQTAAAAGVWHAAVVATVITAVFAGPNPAALLMALLIGPALAFTVFLPVVFVGGALAGMVACRLLWGPSHW